VDCGVLSVFGFIFSLKASSIHQGIGCNDGKCMLSSDFTVLETAHDTRIGCHHAGAQQNFLMEWGSFAHEKDGSDATSRDGSDATSRVKIPCISCTK
jgi:hypothetical protein